MNNRIIYFFLLSILGLAPAACKKVDVPTDTPSCIKKAIKKIQAEKVKKPPASLWQYTYNGQVVYYIPSSCCDLPSQLYDSNCKQLCNPDGGFTGKGDGKCTDFFNTRKNEKQIWEDDRK